MHVAARHRPQAERDAVVDRAGGQRGDDRLQPAVDDDHAVDRAAERADGEHRRPCRARPAAACPTTRCEARQLASTNTMPTDRSRPPVSTGSVCAIATRASSTPLLAAVVTTGAVQPGLDGWRCRARRCSDEHRRRAHRRRGARAGGSASRPACWSRPRSGRRRQVEGAGHERVLGQLGAVQPAHDAAVDRTPRRGRSSRSARRSRSSRTGSRRRRRPAGAAARRSPAWCRRRCRASGRSAG